MARKRNNKTETTDKHQVETTDREAEDLAAIEAMLLGEAEVELDSTEPDAPEHEPASTAPADDHDIVDAALAEIEAKGEAPEETPAASDEDLADVAATSLAAESAKKEAYAEQSSELDFDAEKEPAKAAKGKGEKTEGKTRAPKLEFGDAIKAIHANEPLCLDAEAGALDTAGIDNLIAGVTQKKVQEKVVNLLDGVLHDRNISVYTAIALDLLKQAHHAGEVLTTADIRKAYEAKGYKSGTVNAQQGQMMALFPALGMATRPERGVLKPNPNSVLLDALCS